MIQIAHNPCYAKIFNADREAMNEVQRLLTYRVEGSENMPAFKSGDWDGQSSFFSYSKATFPTGFVRLIAQGLKKAGNAVQVVGKPCPEPLGPLRPEVDAFGYVPRYDYQPEAIDTLVRHHNITVQVATGGGKSRIARMAYKRIDRPTLFITTRGILMHQMKAAVEAMGEQVAVLGDGEWGIPYKRADGTPGRRITKFVVGMVQTLALRLQVKDARVEYDSLRSRRATIANTKIDALQKKLKKDKVKALEIEERTLALIHELDKTLPTEAEDREKARLATERHNYLREATIKILGRFELVIAEEAHEVSGDGFFEVMQACTSGHYRMALTATPFMKDDQAANMRLLGACGPVAVKISEQLLIERGILARPYFKFVKLHMSEKPRELFRTTGWARAYEFGITKNLARNKAICREVAIAKMYGLNSMVLVQRKEHGQILVDYLAAIGIKAMFIFGEDDQPARQKALHALGAGEIDCLVGSTILDVGVDVPSIGLVVLAGGGKAEVALRQRVGRGLREKKNGLPNIAFVVDFQDDFNNHLRDHARERRRIIEDTPGFAEGIVEQFEYEKLGLRRRV